MFKNVSASTQVSRLAWPSIAIGTGLFFVALLASFWLYRIQQGNALLLSRDVSNVQEAYQLELSMRELRGVLTRYLLSNDLEYKRRLPDILTEVKESLTRVSERSLEGSDRHSIEVIKEGFVEFSDIIKEEMAKPRRVFSFEDQVKVDELFESKVVTPAETYRSKNEAAINRASAVANESVSRMIYGFIIMGVCGGFGGVFFGIFMSRKLRNSIIQLSVPIHDAAGKLDRVIGDVQFHDVKDISDLSLLSHRISSHVSEVVDRLQKKDREILRNEQLAAVGQLAAGVAHEIRNPLMAIKILVQSSLEANPQRLEVEDLAVIDEEINRVESSVKALMNFARPNPLNKQYVRVQEMVHNAVRLISGRINVMDIRLDVILPREPIEILIDKVQFHQVLINLLFNAIDEAGLHGQISVEAKSILHAQDREPLRVPGGQVIMISVNDSGMGISPDKMAKVFEPFYSTKSTGTGLGLSVCKRIIEQHGGAISVTSSQLGGASFNVSLPLSECSLTETHQSQLIGESSLQGNPHVAL